MELKKAQTKVQQYSEKADRLREKLDAAGRALQDDPTEEAAVKVRDIQEQLRNITMTLQAAEAAEAAALERERLERIEADKRLAAEIKVKARAAIDGLKVKINTLLSEFNELDELAKQSDQVSGRIGEHGIRTQDEFSRVYSLKETIESWKTGYEYYYKHRYSKER